jgi:hypothetical protein
MKMVSVPLLLGCLAILSGCNHYNDDCDDHVGGVRRPNYSAITNNSECVPAPAPIASAPVPVPAKPAVHEEVKPVVVVPEIKPVATPAPREIQPTAVSVRPTNNVVVHEARAREDFSYENASSF